jgi:carbon monoxide dehydrogenase subunit G
MGRRGQSALGAFDQARRTAARRARPAATAPAAQLIEEGQVVVVEGRVDFAAGRETVWDLLQDPAALQRAIPGCQSLEAAGPDSYRAALKLGIAAVRGDYAAEVTMAERQRPESFRLKINGQGGPGFVNVDGLLHLAENGSDATRVDYRFDVQIGGVIAAVGQRMLGGVAKMMLGEFFKGLQKQLPARA